MRIAIANDMPSVAEALRRAVTSRPGTQVAWIARDGAEAVAMCAAETPDLILMDLIMPKMDGVEATRRIMAATPCAILVVTSSVATNAGRVFEAMGYGAVDAIDTPVIGAGDPRIGAAALLSVIDRILRIATSRYDKPAAAIAAHSARKPWLKDRLVAIGSSAGGPAALAKILGGLPKEFPAAIVIVQHVDENFAIGMADWLNRDSPLPVRVAKEGDRPAIGSVLLAGTRDHLTLKSADRLGYSPDPSDYVYRPSVDVFFHSITRVWPGEAAGVLLTGMGRDGAIGLKALRDKGWHTIAQDQASSAVYGMPKAAAALGAAVDILPLDDIAPKLRRIFAR
jgi:chemotaxis response regulator CheB